MKGIAYLRHRGLIVLTALLVILICTASAEPLGIAGNDGTTAGNDMWLDRIRSNAIPFSFKYDGVLSRDLLPGWQCMRRKGNVGSNRTLLTTEWTDARSGLRVTYDLKLFDDFPAAEWVLFIKNTGAVTTPIIEDVQAMDMFLGGVKGERGPFVVHRTNGAPSNPTDYEVSEVVLEQGKAQIMGGGGGRSSNKDFPFFRVDCGQNSVIIAVGWSGQWEAALSSEEGPAGPRLHIRAGLERTHFRLLPDERVRTPRMLVLFHEGDPSSSNSQFRWLFYRHYAATYRGRKPDPILFCNTCFTRGGGWLNECNEQNQMSLMKALQPLGVEAVITDAGWFRGGWPSGAGNWDVDKAKYPRGMAPVAKTAKDLGMVYGLWFEPERVVEGTQIDRDRGDWVLRRKSGGDGGGLLNFGLPEVQKYFFGIVDEYLRLPGFEVYRQDCNIDPLSFWRENDAPDRQGITEMHYIAGLYAYWDMIKARYPNALMEECASGGRRIELETIMRFHIHQKSDYWFDNVVDQASIYGLSQYLPNGLVSVPLNRLDDYSFHSTLASSLILGWIADGEGFDMGRARTITDTYREIRHLLNGDWYGLTGYSRDESNWLASQYHRADLDEGMVLAFRRKECREDTLRVQLKGLNPATTYEVRFTSTGRCELFTGEQLADALDLTISRTPGSDLILYRKTKRTGRTVPLVSCQLMSPEDRGYNSYLEACLKRLLCASLSRGQ